MHDPFGLFISHLEWFIWTASEMVRPDYFVLTVEGANNDEPQQLRHDLANNRYSGELGLNGAGEKKIIRFVAHLADGTTIDLTDQLIDYFGGAEIDVRFPQEDAFGDCSSFPL